MPRCLRGIDVSKEMAADGLTLAEPAGQAAALSRLQLLKAYPAWVQRYLAGNAAAAEEFHKLTQGLNGLIALAYAGAGGDCCTPGKRPPVQRQGQPPWSACV
jgi:hypothetical protein